jgi:hypothetical protein
MLQETFRCAFDVADEELRHCPDSVPEHVVQRYAKVWLWHFLGTFLFPDSSGNTIS